MKYKIDDNHAIKIGKTTIGFPKGSIREVGRSPKIMISSEGKLGKAIVIILDLLLLPGLAVLLAYNLYLENVPPITFLLPVSIVIAWIIKLYEFKIEKWLKRQLEKIKQRQTI